LADGSLRLVADARQLYPDFDAARFLELPDSPVLPGDEDLESYLRRLGFSETQIQYVRRSYANATGEEPRYISAQAALDDMAGFGSGDYRILDGYDCLPEALAEGLDIRLNTIVEAVDWSGDNVRVHTADGQVWEADNAIITLPLGVLQAGRVRFTPELPADKQAAINNLRMGPVIKLVYGFGERVLPEGIFSFSSALNPPIWWSPSVGQPANGGQVVMGFASDGWARDLLAMGEAGALDKGLASLRAELNCPDLQPTKTHLVNWPGDPFALGGYSVATPGHADARDILARPLSNRLYFAGEATAPNDIAATVHGAYVTGRRAASDVLLNHRDTERTELKEIKS
jgi:monoamine oxidase